MKHPVNEGMAAGRAEFREPRHNGTGFRMALTEFGPSCW